MTALEWSPPLLSPSRRTRSLLISIAVLAITSELPAAPVKILPMGDSITAGYTNNSVWSVPFEYGYRAALYTLLKNAGYDFQFVGASLEPFNNLFGDPTLGGTVYPTLELRDSGINQNFHRGYGGISITTLNSNVSSYIAADNPDVILLMIGINGISASSPSQLNTLVNSIFTAKPAVRLVVAQIIPKIPYNANVVTYNTYIRQTLVPAYAAQGRAVSTVDQYANFLTNPADNTSIDTTKFSNGINHPTNPAYQLMAATWLPAITSIALDTSAISSDTVPGATIATLSRLAPNPAETFSFSLVSGDGDTDNSRFQIQGAHLVAGSYHFELDPQGKTFAIRVQATGNTTGAVLAQSLLLTLVAGSPKIPSTLVETFSSSVQSAYVGDVKNNDLLHGLTGTHLNYNVTSGIASGPRINDDLHGADTVNTGIAWASDGNIASSTFNLGVGDGAGYDVSKITSIAAWNGAGFMNQKYKVSARYSGTSVFTTFPDCSVNFQPFSTSLTAAGATKVVITRPGGLLFSGIEEIRFTLLDTVSVDNGGVTLREIDVEGVRSPVPATRIIEVDPTNVANGVVAVTWQSRPALTYRVESSDDLQSWVVLSPSFPSAGSSTRFVDSTLGQNARKRFYRIGTNP